MPGTFDELTGTAQRPDENRAADPAGNVRDDADASSILLAADTSSTDSDDTRTPRQVREVAKELTRYGLIEAARKPNLYRVLQNQQQALATILEPLDLALAIDDIRGLAFVTVRTDAADDGQSSDVEEDPDDWSHPLVRRQRLTLEQSLLVAILRQHFVAHEQEAGIGADDARVAIDELIPQFQIYLGDPGSEARERTRMLTLLDQLKGQGLVSEPDTHERVTIRPIIAHLASPENLQHLLSWLRQRRTGSGAEAEKATRASETKVAVRVEAGSDRPAEASKAIDVPSGKNAGKRQEADAVSASETVRTPASPARETNDTQAGSAGVGRTGELFGEPGDMGDSGQ
ncbi:DUF4194 domain-containing protein [Granulosicoccus sp. 3-233]|uniref:DUF4194 domain-containing protein n=1 Tax=Granulosicoccus sp. 3-233 TaxID=3417969 RepID=UPI003D345E68